MKKNACIILIMTAGCSGLAGALGALGLNANAMTLLLINETDFTVNPRVFIGADFDNLFFEALTEEVLTIDSNEQDFGLLAAGGTLLRAYDCDEFKAVMAKDAELQSGIGISPEGDTEFFLVDEDFECGDTITIRYVGGLTGFDAQISRTAFDPLSLLETGTSP